MNGLVKVIFLTGLLLYFMVPYSTMYFLDVAGIFKVNMYQVASIFVITSVLFARRTNIQTSNHILVAVYSFLIIVCLSLFVNAFLFNHGISGILYELRAGLVLFAALCILYYGSVKRVYIKYIVIFVLLSYIISLIYYFVGIQLGDVGESEESFSTLQRGRLINGNKDFAIIGLYCLFYLDRLTNSLSKSERFIFVLACVLSILVAILSFDRTLLAVLIIEMILLIFFGSRKSIKKILVGIVLIFLGSFIVTYVYENNDNVRAQVDRRVLSVLHSNNLVDAASDNVWEDNRDFMLLGAIEQIKTYPILGVPANIPLFYYFDGSPARQTDVTIINITAKFGLLALLFYVILHSRIFYNLKAKRKTLDVFRVSYKSYDWFMVNMLLFVLPLYYVYSLNHDVFYRGHLLILFSLLFVSTNHIKKSSLNSLK